MRRAFLLIAALLVATPARAQLGLGVELVVGFAGDLNTDQFDDGDLDRNFGVQLTWARPFFFDWLRLGARGAFLAGEGDNPDGDVRTFDIGALGRAVFPVEPLELFGAVALGPSWGVFDPDPEALDGLGFHFLIGGGATYPLTDAFDIIGGVFFSWQRFPELESDQAELDAVGLTRILVTAGVRF